MKESYGEGLANHTSLESCGDCSNALAEALTEGSTGGLLSSEITNFRVPTTWSGWEGNTSCGAMRATERPGGVEVYSGVRLRLLWLLRGKVYGFSLALGMLRVVTWGQASFIVVIEG